jgi:hypothetical protein
MKEASVDHFDRSTNKYCKIFYRKKNSNNISVDSELNKSLLRRIFMNIFIILFSFFLFIYGTYGTILKKVDNICAMSIVLLPLRIILYLIVSAIWWPMVIVIIPFYPVLIHIVDG